MRHRCSQLRLLALQVATFLLSPRPDLQYEWGPPTREHFTGTLHIGIAFESLRDWRRVSIFRQPYEGCIQSRLQRSWFGDCQESAKRLPKPKLFHADPQQAPYP